MKRPRLRLRLRTRPVVPQGGRRGLWLTDTPRPNHADCDGDGWYPQDYADEHGEYGGTNDVLCGCWSPDRVWRIVPMPRARRRPPPGGYSDEPPF
ncbi:hypothetical protein [Yinghuangia sp. YIM S09857]|uniref:hypothetical protein n=1 Tax=Yinghuangia sp. YIM S09857 TaxID=3436929 RepID=UPI003F5320A6